MNHYLQQNPKVNKRKFRNFNVHNFLPTAYFPVSKNFSFVILASIFFLLSAWLHVWNIGKHPQGLFHDESAIMYNAYSIARTGADEYGTNLPLFFRSFDNYHDPVMVYATAPLTALFGLEPWTGRLVSAIFHLTASVAFFWLITTFVQERYLALTGAFVFSVLPWTFPVSRIVMAGYTPMLLGMILGIYFLIRAYKSDNLKYAAAAGIAWAFAMYSHNIGRPMTAVILVCFSAIYAKIAMKQLKVSVTFISTFLVCLIPLTVSVLRHPESLTSRFNTLSVWHDAPGLLTVLKRISIRYFDYYLPQFLFISGDSNMRHHTGAAGELYVFMLPLLLVGLGVILWKSFHNNAHRFLLLLLLTYPAAAVLTVDRMHSTRALTGSFIWTLICLIGATAILKCRRGKMILTILAMLGILEISLYMHDYFSDYIERSRSHFNATLSEALDYAFSRLPTTQTLTISPSVVPFDLGKNFKPHLYAHLLFYSKLPPSVYQQCGIPEERISFSQNAEVRPGLILRNKVKFVQKEGNLAIIPNDDPLPIHAEKIKIFPYKNSDIAYELYQIKDHAPDEPPLF